MEWIEVFSGEHSVSWDGDEVHTLSLRTEFMGLGLHYRLHICMIWHGVERNGHGRTDDTDGTDAR